MDNIFQRVLVVNGELDAIEDELDMRHVDRRMQQFNLTVDVQVATLVLRVTTQMTEHLPIESCRDTCVPFRSA